MILLLFQHRLNDLTTPASTYTLSRPLNAGRHRRKNEAPCSGFTASVVDVEIDIQGGKAIPLVPVLVSCMCSLCQLCKSTLTNNTVYHIIPTKQRWDAMHREDDIPSHPQSYYVLPPYPITLATAHLAGDIVWCVGGAQVVGSLAYVSRLTVVLMIMMRAYFNNNIEVLVDKLVAFLDIHMECLTCYFQ